MKSITCILTGRFSFEKEVIAKTPTDAQMFALTDLNKHKSISYELVSSTSIPSGVVENGWNYKVSIIVNLVLESFEPSSETDYQAETSARDCINLLEEEMNGSFEQTEPAQFRVLIQ